MALATLHIVSLDSSYCEAPSGFSICGLLSDQQLPIRPFSSARLQPVL
jgi:hypothetical protein